MCEKCGRKNCPILNITECPIYQLWERAETLHNALAEVDIILAQ